MELEEKMMLLLLLRRRSRSRMSRSRRKMQSKHADGLAFTERGRRRATHARGV